MEKIKKFIKENNGLAIFSLLTAAFAWIFPFCKFTSGCFAVGVGCISGAGAVIMGIIALIWLIIKKQKGVILAVLGIILGILAFFIIGGATPC